MQQPSATPAVSSAPAATAPATTASTTASAKPIPSAAVSAAPSAAAAVKKDVEFQVMPDEAVLIIDGAALGVGVRTVPRPPSGTTVTVIARAPGYDDQEVKITSDVPEPVLVILTQTAPEPQPAGATNQPAFTGGSQPTSPATTGIPKSTGPSIVAPPNPYKKN
jgi:hypothetical protein